MTTQENQDQSTDVVATGLVEENTSTAYVTAEQLKGIFSTYTAMVKDVIAGGRAEKSEEPKAASADVSPELSILQRQVADLTKQNQDAKFQQESARISSEIGVDLAAFEYLRATTDLQYSDSIGGFFSPSKKQNLKEVVEDFIKQPLGQRFKVNTPATVPGQPSKLQAKTPGNGKANAADLLMKAFKGS